jgi:hypothetical protein
MAQLVNVGSLREQQTLPPEVAELPEMAQLVNVGLEPQQ